MKRIVTRVYLAQITCRGFREATMVGSCWLFSWNQKPHSVSAPYNSLANVCIIHSRKKMSYAPFCIC